MYEDFYTYTITSPEMEEIIFFFSDSPDGTVLIPCAMLKGEQERLSFRFYEHASADLVFNSKVLATIQKAFDFYRSLPADSGFETALALIHNKLEDQTN